MKLPYSVFFLFLLALPSFAGAPFYVVISVHTEMFNESKLQGLGWELSPSNDSCHNILLLPETILPVLDRHNASATWYIEEDWWYGDSWSSASSCSPQVLGLLAANGEIGLHVHYASSLGALRSMPNEAIADMLNKGYLRLSSAGYHPRSFVAGNYLLSEKALPVLESLNFTSDLSVNPGMEKAGFSRRAPLFPYRPSYSDLNSPGSASILLIPNIGIDISEDRRDFLDTFKRFVLVSKLDSYLMSEGSDVRIVTLVIHSWDDLSKEDLANLDFMLTYLSERGAIFVTASEAADIWRSGHSHRDELALWGRQNSLGQRVANSLTRLYVSFIGLF